MEQRSIGEVLSDLKSKKIYQFLCEYAKKKNVLDYGCSSGYGSAILAEYAKKVIGVDINQKSLNYAIKIFKKPNLIFKLIKINSYPLEFKKQTFEFILSRHYIEHILDVRSYLYELRRILKNDGYLIITTPNRKSRLLPFQKPIHEGHVKEYTHKSLKKELELVFKKVDIKGVYGIKKINKLEKNIFFANSSSRSFHAK